MSNIETIFSDKSVKWSRRVGYPNYIALKGEDGAVVVVRRIGRGRDFALNVAGLEHVVKAEAEGRIKEGYVVLGQQTNEGERVFVACERVKLVHVRLLEAPKNEGQLGPYYWITEQFRCSGDTSDDMPF